MNTLVIVLAGLARLVSDPVPADNDVKAGSGAFVIFIALIVAVALLGYSLVRHLRKAKANAEAGVFDKDADN